MRGLEDLPTRLVGRVGLGQRGYRPPQEVVRI